MLDLNHISQENHIRCRRLQHKELMNKTHVPGLPKHLTHDTFWVCHILLLGHIGKQSEHYYYQVSTIQKRRRKFK